MGAQAAQQLKSFLLGFLQGISAATISGKRLFEFSFTTSLADSWCMIANISLRPLCTEHMFFDCEVLKEDGQACWDSLLVHPASPSHRFQESRCCGKDQWWRAFWPFDWWSSGMEFFHMSCCTRYIQGTKRLLLDWSIKGRGKPL